MIPMHGTDDEFAMRIAKDTQYNVLDVQYRLAPEHPFPAGAHDAEDVVRYVLARPQDYDPDRIVVSGFSAGGNNVSACDSVLPTDQPCARPAHEGGARHIWEVATGVDGGYL
jgi:acetyl esterase/lipase